MVSDAEFERAAAQIDDPIKEHIAFAQNQIRTFATAQRGTLANSRSRSAMAWFSVTG